jgi:hypothetical protein
MHTVRNGRVVKLTEGEELAATATMPGDFARHLSGREGLARRFAPEAAYFVLNDQVVKCNVVELRGAGLEFVGPASYALTADGRLLPCHYMFPVARHLKPRLAEVTDDYGTCQQWVAPLKAKTPWA